MWIKLGGGGNAILITIEMNLNAGAIHWKQPYNTCRLKLTLT